MPYQIGQTISADEFKKSYGIGDTLSASAFKEYQTQLELQKKRQEPGTLSKVGTAATDVGIGAAKGVGSTAFGALSLVQKGLENTAGRAGNAISRFFGFKGTPINEREGYKQLEQRFDTAVETATRPENTAQKAGFITEQAIEFFVPAGVAGKVGKGAELLTKGTKVAKGIKFGTEAVGLAGLTKAQGGDNKAVVGNLALAAGAGLAGKIIGGIANKISPRIVNSLIKPLSKDFEFGKNPGLGVVRENITANSFDDLIGKIGKTKATVGGSIGNVLRFPEVAKQRIDIIQALSPIDDSIKSAAETGDQALIDALMDFRKGITTKFQLVGDKLVAVGKKATKVAPEDALKVKGNVSNSIRWREGIDKELNKVKIRVYQNLRGQIENAVATARKTNKSIPDIIPLNERYANLATAESAAKYRASVVKRLNLTTIGGTLTGGLVNASAIQQDLKEGDVEGLIKDFASVGLFGLGGKALGSVAVKTRAANLVAKLSPEQKSILSKAIPLLRNFFLANANNANNDEE